MEETVAANWQAVTVWDSQEEAALQDAVLIFQRLSISVRSIQFSVPSLFLSPVLCILQASCDACKGILLWMNSLVVLRFGRKWSPFYTPGGARTQFRESPIFSFEFVFQSHAISNHRSFSVRFIGAYQPFSSLRIQLTQRSEPNNRDPSQGIFILRLPFVHHI